MCPYPSYRLLIGSESRENQKRRGARVSPGPPEGLSRSKSVVVGNADSTAIVGNADSTALVGNADFTALVGNADFTAIVCNADSAAQPVAVTFPKKTITNKSKRGEGVQVSKKA